MLSGTSTATRRSHSVEVAGGTRGHEDAHATPFGSKSSEQVGQTPPTYPNLEGRDPKLDTRTAEVTTAGC